MSICAWSAKWYNEHLLFQNVIGKTNACTYLTTYQNTWNFKKPTTNSRVKELHTKHHTSPKSRDFLFDQRCRDSINYSPKIFVVYKVILGTWWRKKKGKTIVSNCWKKLKFKICVKQFLKPTLHINKNNFRNLQKHPNIFYIFNQTAIDSMLTPTGF